MKAKAAKPRRRSAKQPEPPSVAPADGPFVATNLALHELFAQQAAAMLERTDLNEEQKQSILVAMSCPCCGAGSLSFTAKLRRAK